MGNNKLRLTNVHLCSSYDQFIGEHFRSTRLRQAPAKFPGFVNLLSGWRLLATNVCQTPSKASPINAHCLYFIGLGTTRSSKREPKMIVLPLIVGLPKESQRNLCSGMNITTKLISWLQQDNLLCFLIAHCGVHNARKRRPSL